jgi:hypothetical protein
LRKDTERLDIEKAIDFFCNKAFLTQKRIFFSAASQALRYFVFS